MCRYLVVLWTLISILSTPVVASETVRSGFVTTLTTGAAVIGEDMRDAVKLALDVMNGKMGPLKVEVIFENDAFNPQTGKQVTEKLIKRDEVDVVAGYIWSHVLLASAPVVLRSGKVLISANAGPSKLAGAGCHPNFFNISWQNDQIPMAMGEVLNRRSVESLYIIAPNYAAGKDMVSGVERTFRGVVVGKDMTAWPDQIDWSAELTKVRATKPEAVFIFYPGKHGLSFIKQYTQAGLVDIPLYSVFTIDALSLPRFQEAGMEEILGTDMTMFWAPDMDNIKNQEFVERFKSQYGRYPSFYAAQSYDAMFLIKSAVEAVEGDLDDVEGFRASLEKADFDSVRGPFKFGRNHFPIQNFYTRTVVRDSEDVWTTSLGEVVLQQHTDVHASKCKM